MRYRQILVAALLLCLAPARARASTITFSNTSLRTYNGVIVHVPGEYFSTRLLSEELSGAPPEIELSHDLGFASAAALAGPSLLTASSHADARDVGLGYDEVVAEGSAHYATDFLITGGTDEVDLLIIATQLVNTSTDEPGVSIGSLRAIRLFQNGEVFYGMRAALSSDIVRLDHDVLYHLEVDFVANSRATVGHSTSNDRALQLGVQIVPEPGSGALLCLGLALACGSRGPTLSTSGRRSSDPSCPVSPA